MYRRVARTRPTGRRKLLNESLTEWYIIALGSIRTYCQWPGCGCCKVSVNQIGKGIEALHIGVGDLRGAKDSPLLVRVTRLLVPDDRSAVGDVA